MHAAHPRDPAAFREARRGHVVDDIFEQLLAAVVRGDLPAGQALPAERILAERFSASRTIVRQAVHRLAEHGLVRVRQGGASIVCDPDESTDPRVIAAMYQAAPRISSTLRADLIEKQCLQGLCFVEGAARRAPREALDGLAALVEEVAADEARLADFAAFEADFWERLVRAGHNQIYRKEIAWWRQMTAARPLPIKHKATNKQRLAFFRELVRRLIAGQDATGYYLQAVRAILDEVLPVQRRGARA